MPKIVRLKQSNEYVYPETVFKAVRSEQNRPLTDYFSEYNVSYLHTNPSTGENTFTLEEAINAVPEEYRHPRMKITYIDSSTGEYITYICHTNSYSEDPEDWRTSFEDGSVATEDSSGLMSPEDKRKLNNTPDSFNEIPDSSIDIITG